MLRMVLEVNHHQGKPDLYCPQTFCDTCGERIEDARQGDAHRRLDERGRPIDGVVYHVHKRCNRALEASMPGRWLWEPLEVLPIRQAANLNVDEEQARKTARLLGSF